MPVLQLEGAARERRQRAVVAQAGGGAGGISPRVDHQGRLAVRRDIAPVEVHQQQRVVPQPPRAADVAVRLELGIRRPVDPVGGGVGEHDFGFAVDLQGGADPQLGDPVGAALQANVAGGPEIAVDGQARVAAGSRRWAARKLSARAVRVSVTRAKAAAASAGRSAARRRSSSALGADTVPTAWLQVTKSA